MGKALYRTHRSRKLSEIVGQEHVTTLLANAISQQRIAHAYLFTGPRGVGKTSIARILAHEINGLDYSDNAQHLDIIEIDAASNNSVDDIRELRDKVMIAPTSAKYKIYIIDEVHMLSKQAFNALLKTLEEPPAHAIFMLATTDVDKLPDTIISRTQRYTFRRASIENLMKNLRRVADAEKINVKDPALEVIAHQADGSYRDSLTLLDQLASLAGDSEVTTEMIESSLGLAPRDRAIQLLDAITAGDNTDIIAILRELESTGIDALSIAKQLIQLIVERTSTQPELLSFINPLADVATSNYPNASLLAALASSKKPVSHSAPLAAEPAPAVILSPLEQKATEDRPKDDLVPQTSAPAPAKAPASKPKATPKPSPKPVSKAKTESAEANVQKTGKAPTGELDWTTLVNATKEDSIGLYSILMKCSHEISGNTLTIYAKSEFWKKKFATATSQQTLHTLLVAQTGGDWEINVLAEAPPMKNSQAASIAAMMGGGEEVSI